MGFQQGLSGLNAASKSLDTIGNNVANSNTVGFKASQTQFADVYASSLTGAGTSQIGIGVKVSQVSQQFTQGNITGSNNPLDIAINGNGFFRMSDNGTIIYARNGQFQFDKNGYIVNANGSRLTGYIANSAGVLSTGAPAEININTADLPPVQTTGVKAILNLNSTQSVPSTSPFNMSDPTSYNNGTSVSVYDSLGNSHVLQTFYVKTGANSWDVYGATDGVQIGYTAAAPVTNAAGTVVAPGAPTSFTAIAANTFSINGVSIGAIAAGTDAITQGANVATAINASLITGVTAAADPLTGVVTITNTVPAVISMNGTAGTIATATANLSALLAQTGFDATQVGTQASAATIGTLNFNSSGALTTTAPLNATVAVTTGAVTPFSVPIDYAGTTQFGSPFSVNTLTQDGYASGRLTAFDISSDGIISGRYTNGQSNTLGQVVLASFTNPNGLQPLGNNVWAETSSSGVALVGGPNTGSLGVLQASAVEDSNVDLTAELVNMITAQRYYQANAQTIKAQDEILQTLVNLR